MVESFVVMKAKARANGKIMYLCCLMVKERIAKSGPYLLNLCTRGCFHACITGKVLVFQPIFTPVWLFAGTKQHYYRRHSMALRLYPHPRKLLRYKQRDSRPRPTLDLRPFFGVGIIFITCVRCCNPRAVIGFLQYMLPGQCVYVHLQSPFIEPPRETCFYDIYGAAVWWGIPDIAGVSFELSLTVVYCQEVVAT